MGLKEGAKTILLTLVQSVQCLEAHSHSSDCQAPPRISYREQQADLRRRVGRIHELRNSHLLDTMERGVLYPVLSIDWSPGRDAKENCRKLQDTDFGPDLYVLQGLYEEVRRIEPVSSRVETGKARSYIVLGFKSLESSVSSVLEKTWRDWTGARSIYLNLHSDFDLVKIVFYHRVVPQNLLDLFMYLVIVELADVRTDNLIRLLDFVQRTRVERMTGYMSLYRDLGAMDTDSNYFSGGETERGESKLSNYTDRKLSDSSSCSDTSCPGSMLSGDTNYFSDSNFSDRYAVTLERRQVYERLYTEKTCRRVTELSYRGGHSYGQSAHNSPVVGRTANRNSSLLDSDPHESLHLPSPLHATAISRPSAELDRYNCNIPAETDNGRRTATRQTGLFSPGPVRHNVPSSNKLPTRQASKTLGPVRPEPWSNPELHPSTRPARQESWNDPARQPSSSGSTTPLISPPSPFIFTSERVNTPPVGFTNQVNQLKEALSIIQSLPKRSPAALRPHPEKRQERNAVGGSMVGSVAGTIRSSLIIKTKQ